MGPLARWPNNLPHCFQQRCLDSRAGPGEHGNWRHQRHFQTSLKNTRIPSLYSPVREHDKSERSPCTFCRTQTSRCPCAGHTPQAGQGWGRCDPAPVASDLGWCLLAGACTSAPSAERPRERLLEARTGRLVRPCRRWAPLWSPQVECFFCPAQLKASL